jgi:hypothetical protein
MTSVATTLKLKEYEIEEFPKPIDKFEEILNSVSGKKKEDAILRKVLGEEYVVYKEIQKLRSRQNHIQAIMPWQLEIK